MLYGLQKASPSSLIRRKWLQTEMRVAINWGKVRQYAEEMRAGCIFPAPVVFVDQKTETFLVGDGFHRILAHKENKVKELEVELRRGRYFEAMLHNIDANKSNKGLPWTTGDKRKCIETLLRHEEAGTWTGTKIAETVGCDKTYVSYIRRLIGEPTPASIVDRHGRKKTIVQPESSEEKNKKIAKAAKMRSKGAKLKEIALALNVTESTASHYVSEAMHHGSLAKCPHCGGSGWISNL